MIRRGVLQRYVSTSSLYHSRPPKKVRLARKARLLEAMQPNSGALRIAVDCSVDTVYSMSEKLRVYYHTRYISFSFYLSLSLSLSLYLSLSLFFYLSLCSAVRLKLFDFKLKYRYYFCDLIQELKKLAKQIQYMYSLIAGWPHPPPRLFLTGLAPGGRIENALRQHIPGYDNYVVSSTCDKVEIQYTIQIYNIIYNYSYILMSFIADRECVPTSL